MISAFECRRVYSCLKHIWKITKKLESRTIWNVSHVLRGPFEGAGDKEAIIPIPV